MDNYNYHKCMNGIIQELTGDVYKRQILRWAYNVFQVKIRCIHSSEKVFQENHPDHIIQLRVGHRVNRVEMRVYRLPQGLVAISYVQPDQITRCV